MSVSFCATFLFPLRYPCAAEKFHKHTVARISNPATQTQNAIR